MISVIIPTHDSRYLTEAIASVRDQSCADWEAVIIPNGGADLTGRLPQDDRIRIVPYDGAPMVGAIKRFGFTAARGDILVELDHDDLLAPQALERIRDTLSESPADFAYSNFAEFREESGEPVVYSEYWGWRSRPATFRGRPVQEMLAFEPSPQSLAYVWFAPHHVRAWTRGGYERSGGHDPALALADDHDLLIRTYLTGRMIRIDECLYLRRAHAAGALQARTSEIELLSRQLYARWIDDLVARWCSLSGLPCLDIGGWHGGAPGWVTFEAGGREVQADLRQRWPWADSSVGAFRARNLLQLLPDKRHTLAEIHRCLAPGGWLLSETPSAAGVGAFIDPANTSWWARRSFDYWTRRETALTGGNRGTFFRTFRLEEGFPSDWHRDEGAPSVWFDAVCLKGEMDGPGPRDI